MSLHLLSLVLRNEALSVVPRKPHTVRRHSKEKQCEQSSLLEDWDKILWDIPFRLQRFVLSFQARHNFGIVEIDGMLYILGGEDGDRELISMECYDIYSKTWTKQPDLTMVRKVSGAVCCSCLQSVSLWACLLLWDHTQGLPQFSAAEQSPQHTSSLLKYALGTAESAQEIKMPKFCLLAARLHVSSHTSQHRSI